MIYRKEALNYFGILVYIRLCCKLKWFSFGKNSLRFKKNLTNVRTLIENKTYSSLNILLLFQQTKSILFFNYLLVQLSKPETMLLEKFQKQNKMSENSEPTFSATCLQHTEHHDCFVLVGIFRSLYCNAHSSFLSITWFYRYEKKIWENQPVSIFRHQNMSYLSWDVVLRYRSSIY